MVGTGPLLMAGFLISVREWEVYGADLQLEEVKEKENLPVKLVLVLSCRSRWTASSPSSSSSCKSSTVRNNFFSKINFGLK